MISDLYKEIENRRAFIEKCDFEIQNQNTEHFRSFWLNINILSGAIVVGLLPIITSESGTIKSLILAKLGLLLIISICTIVTVYFQSVSARGKYLLFDQIECHRKNFSRQRKILVQAEKEGKTEKEIFDIYNQSKDDFSMAEFNVIEKHILGGRFVKIRLFFDKHFNSFVSWIFTVGILLIILSFIVRA